MQAGSEKRDSAVKTTQTRKVRAPMKSITDRIKEIEERITHVKGTYEAILQIHTQVDRKKRSLETELKILADQKEMVMQGQLPFDPDMGF